MDAAVAAPTLRAKDYKSGRNPVWCPGCGHFAVLSAVTKALAYLRLPKEEVAVVSGIGCSSRVPAYLDAYGFHGIHGRALPLASGLKAARPDLTVLVAGGDGDGFSIGGNHFLHACRRNMDLTYVVMDNEVYGMTKGQASPTTQPDWAHSKLTPHGTGVPRFQPAAIALAAGASFIARGFSGDPNGLTQLLVEAIQHPGIRLRPGLEPLPDLPSRAESMEGQGPPLPRGHDRQPRRGSAAHPARRRHGPRSALRPAPARVATQGREPHQSRRDRSGVPAMSPSPIQGPQGPIASIAEFLVHALELEHESAERYLELAGSMEVHNNHRVADLFRQLAAMSETHAREVQDRAAGLQLPQIPPWGFKWRCPGSPEVDCGHAKISYLMTAVEVLEVALLNETRSRDFYAWVAVDSPHPEVRTLAAEMAEEEGGHVLLLEAWINDEAQCEVAPTEDLDPPNVLG